MDFFATRDNHHLPCYVSPNPDPEAMEVNALSLPWNQWASIYLFPPVPLLPKVSSLLLQFQGRGVLVAPFYAQSSWLPNLLLRSPSPIPLPSDHSLSQRTSKGLVFHPDPSAYHLHAWRLWMGLIAAGFYEATADVYLRSYRPSSTKQYQSVWRKFLSFPSPPRMVSPSWILLSP